MAAADDHTFHRISRHLDALKIMVVVDIALTFAVLCKLMAG